MLVEDLRSPNDVVELLDQIKFPVILQRKIEGELTAFDGIFLNGELVFFGRSAMSKSMRNKAGVEFGPSAVRQYVKNPFASRSDVSNMRLLGASLHGHGFCNITSIVTPDGEVWFFEADMRPNVWAEDPKYFGQDPAECIRSFYSERKLKWSVDNWLCPWASICNAGLSPKIKYFSNY